MACAYLEFGLQLGLKKIIGLMPTYIYRSVFERPGIEMSISGRSKRSGGQVPGGGDTCDDASTCECAL